MPTTISIAPGGQTTKDPYDWKFMYFNWDQHLETGVEILSSGEFVISDITEPPEDPISLVIDEVEMVPGNRMARIRVSGGLVHHAYNVAHRVRLNTTPETRRERSFTLWVKEK